MRTRFGAILVGGGLLFLLGAGCQSGGGSLPANGNAAAAPTAAASAFDANRAFADLKTQCAFGPRVPSTQAHTKTRDWMVEELRKSADTVSRQDFTYSTEGKTLPLSNVVAEINAGAAKKVLLCAHWDTRPVADQEIDPARRKQPISGANDGASGVAVILELARVFKAKRPDIGVQIVLFDGEDYGDFQRDQGVFLGSRHYAKDPVLGKPAYAILLDMVGDKDLGIYREGNSERNAPEVNEKIWRAADALGVKSFRYGVRYTIEDDHVQLQNAGWKAVDLIDFDYAPWHTLDDTPDKCSPAALKAVGDVLARVIYDEKP